MRLGRLLVVVVVWGVALIQAGCTGCGDLPVTYGFPGGPSGDTCADGLSNGDETDVDCGGSCQPCGSGADICQSDADCPGGVCRNGVCSEPACTDSARCSAGYECHAGSCVTDTFAPRVETAFLPGSTVLRVRFSEPMQRDDSTAGILNPDNYCVELTDETPDTCTPSDGFWLGSTLTSGDARSVDIQLPFSPGGGRYTVRVSGVVDRAGHALLSPRHADFDVGGPLRLVSAASQGSKRVLLTFSRSVVPGPDASGSAGCASPATCAARYRLSGVPSLGAVLSAEVRPAPHDNEVLLTHAVAQGGGQYTVLAANGVDGDGLEDVTAGAIAPTVGGERLGSLPLDRATFTGSGPAILSFEQGPVQTDPFADGAGAPSVVPYRGRVHLGPNGNGMRALGVEPEGLRSEELTFRFRKDTQKLVGSRSANTAGAPFPAIGFAGCRAHTHQCGPDNEDGRALLASGTLGDTEWLMMGGSQSGGGLDYVYMTRDDDPTLDMKYVDLGEALDGTVARSFSALGLFGGRAYLAIPTSGGTRRPELLALLRAPAADAQGLEARGNGPGGGACKPSSHDVCNLAAHRMPGIGAAGTPANPARTVGIDFVGEFNGKLYLGNNGGLVRATVAQPLDYESSPTHWVSITPSAAEYRLRDSLTTDKTTDLEPSDRAWSRMVVLNGHVYLGRNTTAGPQLWRCDPATVSGPAPASAQDCDAGDWVLIAANDSGDGRLSQFDNPNNTRLTLLAVNGGQLYVGFDNAVEGVVVYRSTVGAPASRSDFTGQGGCSAATVGCEGLGGNGFGEPARNTRLGDAATVGSGQQGFLYVPVSGGPGTPVRLYRQRN